MITKEDLKNSTCELIHVRIINRTYKSSLRLYDEYDKLYRMIDSNKRAINKLESIKLRLNKVFCNKTRLRIEKMKYRINKNTLSLMYEAKKKIEMIRYNKKQLNLLNNVI